MQNMEPGLLIKFVCPSRSNNQAKSRSVTNAVRL